MGYTRYISIIAATITDFLCTGIIVIYGYLTGFLNANRLTVGVTVCVSILFSAMLLDQLDDVPIPVLHYILTCPCIFSMALSILNMQTAKWILLFFTIFTIVHTWILVCNKQTDRKICFLFVTLSLLCLIGSYLMFS